jgi:uncharacterized protein YndB with AHSA1/START domain
MTETAVTQPFERELVVTRRFAAPPAQVFRAWTTPELMQRWWAPRSMGAVLMSCAQDVRVGGAYRLGFGDGTTEAVAFFGSYREVEPDARLVWSNEEGGEEQVTTVTFRPLDGGTELELRELHPSPESLEAARGGTEACVPEQFRQLDALLEELAAEV